MLNSLRLPPHPLWQLRPITSFYWPLLLFLWIMYVEHQHQHGQSRSQRERRRAQSNCSLTACSRNVCLHGVCVCVACSKHKFDLCHTPRRVVDSFLIEVFKGFCWRTTKIEFKLFKVFFFGYHIFSKGWTFSVLFNFTMLRKSCSKRSENSTQLLYSWTLLNLSTIDLWTISPSLFNPYRQLNLESKKIK